MATVPDQGLLNQKGGSSFPFCAFFDAQGDVLFEVNPKSRDDFDRGLKAAQLLIALRKKARDDPKDLASQAGAQLLDAIGRRQRKSVPRKKKKDLAATPELDPEALAIFERCEFEADFLEVLRNSGGSDAKAADLVIRMHRERRLPAAGSRYELAFYYYCAQSALHSKDATSAARFLDRLRALSFKQKASIRREIESELREMSKRLKALKNPAPAKKSKRKAGNTLGSAQSLD